MGLSVGSKVHSEALCTLALSFHHEGQQGTTLSYVCDEGTYVAYYDEIVGGHGRPVNRFEVAEDFVEEHRAGLLGRAGPRRHVNPE